ncbi:MAG: hypothetical protein NBV67_10035 [Tagaea sp.]|nr:hypothetical protein [Tagaea sp.]
MRRLALLFALWAGPALAQGIGAQGTAELERLYASRDWRGVSERMRLANSEVEARATLQWAAGKTMDGAPHVVALAYADLLWRIGQGRGDDALRHEGAVVTLYALALAAVDGAACVDRSAVEARVNQILAAAGARVAYLRALPAEARADAKRRVSTLEQTTFLRRPEDSDLCRAGQGEIARQLRTPGTEIVEHPLQPGQVSRTLDIKPGPSYRPQLHPPQEARVRREVQRQQRLPALLADLVPG